MAPVQSRLVLAVSIPAAALAIFLSLFWLRRASKGHPPSPPDIPDKQDTEVVDKCERSSSASLDSDTSQRFADESSSESVDKISSCDSAFAESPRSFSTDTLSSPGINKDGVCQSVPPVEETNKSFSSEGCEVTPDASCPSESEKTEPVDSEPTQPVVECTRVDDKFISDQKISKVDTTTVPLVITENTEELVSAVHIKENQSAPPERAVVPLIESVSEIKTASKMITEETSSPIKLGYEKETDIVKSDLSEKLANLELDTMKMGDVDVKERDSANHSPSEIMLASPSMSNFSDAHSEGSSDSGKGHSDGTTSPSRTPAGGSSVSGDPSPSIYEFVIPQVIVGRLIGRHGVFLHEIMSVTHTNIFIKVHPDTVKLKICAIEGSQQDIEKALEMIRKKFPSRRYPKLTLERVSFVQLQHSQQLRSEDFHLQLIEGVNNDVILSSLLSPGQFFVQQPCHPSYPCLTPLTQTLTQAYSTTDPPALVNPVPDAICVCPSLGGWYRAQIVGVDDDARHCDIKFVDYGGYLRVDASLLKQIRADFLMLPFQAVECSLANIQPIHEAGWSEEARVFVHNMTFGRVLQAQVVTYTEAGIPLVNLYTSINAQVVLVNAELVSNGYGVYTATASQDEEEAESVPEQLPI